jgi:hypothetical protein
MDVETVLATYIVPSTAADLGAMAEIIDAHVLKVTEIADQRDFVDLDLASKLATALRELLVQSDQYTGRERALLAGAIRYFADNDDVNSDLASPTGFEDDAEVLNAVAVYLGRGDLVVVVE